MKTIKILSYTILILILMISCSEDNALITRNNPGKHFAQIEYTFEQKGDFKWIDCTHFKCETSTNHCWGVKKDGTDDMPDKPSDWKCDKSIIFSYFNEDLQKTGTKELITYIHYTWINDDEFTVDTVKTSEDLSSGFIWNANENEAYVFGNFYNIFESYPWIYDE